MMSDIEPTNTEKEIERENRARQLTELAEELRYQIPELRKPFIIEFSGTPKAGKSSSIDAMHLWFRRNEIDAIKITERASICPLRSKKDPSFNIWTGCATVNQLLESLESPAKIIMFDRGIFDIITWMEFHKNRGAITEDEFIKLKEFYLNKRLVKNVQIVIALTTEPEVAINRELKDQITDIPGQIMNEQVLYSLNDTINYCIETYGGLFNNIITFNTSKENITDNLAKIVLQVGESIKKLIDEEIAVVPRSLILKHIDPSKGILLGKQNIFDLLYNIRKNVIWMRRSQAENSKDYIQLIPVGTFYRKKEILVVTNRGYRHGRMAEHIAIWAGGHSRRSDNDGEAKTEFLRNTLKRELFEELEITENIDLIPKLPVAFVWDNFNEKSTRHLGVFYKMYQSKIKNNLHIREFPESGSKSIYSEFRPINNDLTEFKGWESWSRIYLKNVHNLDFPEDTGQLFLFGL